MLRLVVGAELDVVRVAAVEAKTDPPLVVDGDGMLSSPSPLEGVQSVSRRYAQVGEGDGDMDGFELAQCSARDVRRDSLRLAGPEELLGPSVGERLDHIET